MSNLSRAQRGMVLRRVAFTACISVGLAVALPPSSTSQNKTSAQITARRTTTKTQPNLDVTPKGRLLANGVETLDIHLHNTSRSNSTPAIEILLTESTSEAAIHPMSLNGAGCQPRGQGNPIVCDALVSNGTEDLTVRFKPQGILPRVRLYAEVGSESQGPYLFGKTDYNRPIVWPSSRFYKDCKRADAACERDVLKAINEARAMEGLGNLKLPSNYRDLSLSEQLIAVTNAERVSRGLPAFTVNATLNVVAHAGAVTDSDPKPPSGGGDWASNWAGGMSNPLMADFFWMYDDGPNGFNVDCTKKDMTHCWGHRVNILMPWRGSMGVSVVADKNRGNLALAQLMVQDYPGVAAQGLS